MAVVEKSLGALEKLGKTTLSAIVDVPHGDLTAQRLGHTRDEAASALVELQEGVEDSTGGQMTLPESFVKMGGGAEMKLLEMIAQNSRVALKAKVWRCSACCSIPVTRADMVWFVAMVGNFAKTDIELVWRLSSQS